METSLRLTGTDKHKWYPHVFVYMEKKKFEAEYSVFPGDQPETDVSFTLSEEAEDVLFKGLAKYLHDKAEEGIFEEQAIHLYQRLAYQKSSHPPWFEIDEKRTYDLRMNKGDYRILTDIIGEQIKSVIGVDAADPYLKLIGVWDDITERILIEQDIQETIEEIEDEIKDEGVPDPDNGEFQCFIYGGSVAVFENDRTGSTWHYCTECGNSYPNIPSTHECLR